jgi:tetratricopeptide (TPR) repeat protein
LGIAPLKDYYAQEKEDWRGAVQYLQDVFQDGDLVLCDGMFYGGGGDAWRAVQGISYYLEEEEGDYLILGADSDLDLSYVESIRQGRRVWGILYRKTPLANIQAAGSKAEIVDFTDVSVVRLLNSSGDLLQDVITMLDTFILLHPLSEPKFDLYLLKAKLYIKQARFADADRAIQMAITVNPSNDQSVKALQSVYVYWGQTLREQGEYQQAIRKYLDALKLGPASASTHVNLGFSYIKVGQMDEALSHLREALAIAPDSYWAHHLMGSWYRLKGMSNEAVAEYQKALDIDPTLPGPIYLMALVYEQQGRYNEATVALERYIEAAQDGAYAADAQKRLYDLKAKSQ